jgi:hypothetical protein
MNYEDAVSRADEQLNDLEYWGEERIAKCNAVLEHLTNPGLSQMQKLGLMLDLYSTAMWDGAAEG